MDQETKPAYRLLRTVALAYARADRVFRRAEERLRREVGQLLGHALEPAEQARLSIDLYGSGELAPAAGTEGLWPWEAEWFARRLPPAPAFLLLGGAGAGREAGPLRRLGYRVDAFEPAEAAARRCAEIVEGAGQVLRGTYQDLARATLEGEAGALTPLAGHRYDAVVLGWGSFTHLLDLDDRRRALAACDRLTPEGPILASFWLVSGRETAPRRGTSIGLRIGRTIRRFRGMSGHGNGDAFTGWCGFAHPFSRAEIDDLAAGINRRAVWEAEQGSYPHVTLLPR
jgi:hypothetical protein